MNVFCDLHQDDLYYSLHLLFEKRLGWKLYRPIGMDWWKCRLWIYNNLEDTSHQYLDIHDCDVNHGTWYECPEGRHEYSHRALTLEQFWQMPIDIIIASVTSHEEPYSRLTWMHKDHPKFVRHVGNVHDTFEPVVCKNIMASAFLFDANTLSHYESKGVAPDKNIVTYHQEFDLNTFSFQPPSPNHRITNLMNCVPDSRDYTLWELYKMVMPDFDWKMHGILGHDGIIGTTRGVAQAFHDTTFVWHLKFGGDGMGHVIHNAFATGRPPIVKGSYYKDKMAGQLMEHEKTCLDLEQYSDIKEACQRIRYWAEPEHYEILSRNAHDRFKQVVDFDAEFIRLKEFFDRLI